MISAHCRMPINGLSQRRFRLGSVAFLAAVLFFGLDGLVQAERQEVRRSYDLRPGAIIALENINGDITITSWGESRAEVVAVKTGRADQFEDVEISIDATPSRLDIRTIYVRRKNNQVSVNYTLKVPRNVHLDRIKSISGDVEVSGIEGRAIIRSTSGSLRVRQIGQEADLDTTSGDVFVSHVAGNTSASSISGSVEASDLGGDLIAKGISGDITIRQVKGYITVGTVSGDVRILDSNTTSLKASTTNGDVYYSGSLNPNGRYELKSHSGTVEVVLPANSQFAIQASTFSGSIETDFEVKLQGRIERRSLSGLVGQGGPTLELRSFSGEIRLRKSGRRV